MKLSKNAITILERRYLKKDKQGNLETPQEMFTRVAMDIAKADKLYGQENVEKTASEFYDLMANLEFLPNSPTLRGAGRKLQQLSACFVLPIEDSLESIMDILKYSSLVHKTGGGTGFGFSKLRPRGDIVSSTGNIAGGPVSFMRLFDAMTKEVTQGGVRMGANMGILSIHHPDIVEFILSKKDNVSLSNFNISVAATDIFFNALKNNTKYPLVNPRTNKCVKEVFATDIFDLICQSAWETGDPGMIFIDEINKKHPVSHLGLIESTNPCGEQPLLPYESCNLGSINLNSVFINGVVDYDSLERIVYTSVHFLDNVIDRNSYVLAEIKSATRGTRKIGLGVMGFADLLIKMKIPYESDEALNLAEKIMDFIQSKALEKSLELGESRGTFPYYKGSVYEEKSLPVRNSCMTTIAPTGTLSTLANASSGIEPIFAVVYNRKTLFNAKGSTETLLIINDDFEKLIKEEGIYSQELIEKVSKKPSIQDIKEIPEHIRELFLTAHDISPIFHVQIQAAFQKYIDAATSKTINLPNSATIDNIKQVYLEAYNLHCKGITVYRDNSKRSQVLNTGTNEKVKIRDKKLEGRTYKQPTPVGSAYVTVNKNGIDPFEVFINIGKVGSDIAADAEALGRLISLILRIPSELNSKQRIEEVVSQLKGIGSGRQQGFGPKRVMSLPDGIAQVLIEDLMLKENELPKLPDMADYGDICPDCGNATLLNIEGCSKCDSCGYSEC